MGVYNMTKESKDEQVGFHKGALAVLSKEREEMQRITSICEQLIQMHMKALADLGVDLSSEEKEAAESPKKPKKPIEDLL